MSIDIHDLDKRLSNVEQQCIYLNSRLLDDRNDTKARFDKIDKSLADVKTQLDSMQRVESEKTGSSRVIKLLVITCYSAGMLLAGLGIHDFVFKKWGIG